MNILIIQEAGRHEKNKEFRESLCIQRALSKMEGINSIVWGLNYPTFNTPFDYLEKWADVIFILENYHSVWMPIEKIKNTKKLKIFWSIDSHCVLQQHQELCKTLKINILLNSSEQYIPYFKNLVDKSYWFPNCYCDELIFPLKKEKTVDVGFCGSIFGNRPNLLKHLEKFNIKKDNFVIGNDMVEAINSYKIHFNNNISDDINYRTFETCGCETFLLTNYTPNLEKLFEIGKEIEVYSSLEELDEKINYYLNNPQKRIEVGKMGHQRVIRDHTYYTRMKFLLQNIIL